MAESIRLQVEVDSDAVIVTMPGTTFRVVYRIPTHAMGLLRLMCRGPARLRLRWPSFLPVHGSWPTTRQESLAGLFSSTNF